MILRLIAFAFALMAQGAIVHAQQGADRSPALARPALPGIGAQDRRVRIDPNGEPWRAVGKLQATTGNLHTSCTGTLVGAATVLTAAHCVFNIRTRQYFPPASLHFLIGYDRGTYVGHAVGVGLVTGPGFDPARPLKTLGSDWALLTIDRKLGTPDRVLTIRDRPPDVGTTVMIGGYSQDHPLVLTVDSECRIVEQVLDGNGRRVLRHNCTATRGASGAPVLVSDGTHWRIGGVDVAAEMGVANGLAAILDEARKQQDPPG
jgi:protease YdgD